MDLINRKQLCEQWGVSINTLKKLTASVPKYRIGRTIKFKKTDIEEFLNQNKIIQ